MSAPARSATAEERRRLLGDDVIAHIHKGVEAAPPPRRT